MNSFCNPLRCSLMPKFPRKADKEPAPYLRGPLKLNKAG